MLKLNFYYNDSPFSLDISKINLFYGYSQSGKTTLARLLEQGLLGKDKSFSMNSLGILKDLKNVIYIDSKESILDHIKLSSKSYLKRYYYANVLDYLNNNDEILSNINNNFLEINNKLDNLSNKFNDNSNHAKISLSLNINNNEDLLNNFINVELTQDYISSSVSKEMLLNLIFLLNSSDKETHIIIDDFDSYLDEESTIYFFNQIKDFNGYLYLFSNKSTSLLYTIDRFNIFNVRNNKILNFSNFLFLFKKSLEEKQLDIKQTYEEYMLNYGYYENSGLLEKDYNIIKNNSICNFGRILTTKDYIITNTIDYTKVSIIPSTTEEHMFLNYIDNLINND